MADQPHAAVARSIVRLRKERKWSARELAEKLQAQGCDMTRSMISNFENGRLEDIGVNKLAHLAKAFNVEPWSLAEPAPACLDCENNPPAGFRCMTCGLDKPRQSGSAAGDGSWR